MRPAANPRGENSAESSLPMGLPTVEKTIPRISSREGEAISILSQRDAENMTERSLKQSKSTPPVQSRPTVGVSDSASAASPITEHLPSMASITTLGTKTDLPIGSKSDDNDEKPGKKSHSLVQNQVLPSFQDPLLHQHYTWFIIDLVCI